MGSQNRWLAALVVHWVDIPFLAPRGAAAGDVAHMRVARAARWGSVGVGVYFGGVVAVGHGVFWVPFSRKTWQGLFIAERSGAIKYKPYEKRGLGKLPHSFI